MHAAVGLEIDGPGQPSVGDPKPAARPRLRRRRRARGGSPRVPRDGGVGAGDGGGLAGSVGGVVRLGDVAVDGVGLLVRLGPGYVRRAPGGKPGQGK